MNRYEYNSAVKTKFRYTIQESKKHCENMERLLKVHLQTQYEGNIFRERMLGYSEAEQLTLHFKTDTPQDLILAVTHYLDTLVKENRLFYFIEYPKLSFNGEAQFVCDMAIGRGHRRFMPIEE